MLTATVTITVKDLRALHALQTRADALAKYFDKVQVDDPIGRLVVQPLSESQLQDALVLSDKACLAMLDKFNSLPADHPDVLANIDDAELWTPFPHQIEQMRENIANEPT